MDSILLKEGLNFSFICSFCFLHRKCCVHFMCSFSHELLLSPNNAIVSRYYQPILSCRRYTVTVLVCMFKKWQYIHILSAYYVAANMVSLCPRSHTSRAPAVSLPCPVCLDPSGHHRASPTRATSNQSDQPQCPPCPPSPRLILPSPGSRRGPADRSSTPASTRSAPTWTWTYGTLLPTAAPTHSSPTTPATVETFKKKKKQRNGRP